MVPLMFLISSTRSATVRILILFPGERGDSEGLISSTTFGVMVYRLYSPDASILFFRNPETAVTAAAFLNRIREKYFSMKFFFANFPVAYPLHCSLITYGMRFVS